MLTDNARRDFLEYHYNQVDFTEESHKDYWRLFLDSTEEIHQLASIIDWLDSEGICVECGIYPDDYGNIEFSVSIFGITSGWDDDSTYENRQDATQAAIEKANELYNGQKKH